VPETAATLMNLKEYSLASPLPLEADILIDGLPVPIP